MWKKRTTLLAGVAALALIAGAGAASAQQTGNEGHGAKPPGAASQMNKAGGKMGQNTGARSGTAGKINQSAAQDNKAGGKMGQNTSAQETNAQGRGKMEQNAAGESRTGDKLGQNAEEQNRGKAMQHSAQYDRNKQRTAAGRESTNRGKTAQERERYGNHENMAQHNERNGQSAQRNERNGQNTAEREHNGLKGLQGNARVNVQLNDQQRTRIRETVIDAHGAPRIGHVDFNVTVGTVIPRAGVRIIPVTPALVQIDPSWRGLRYFVYEQELVLVDPATMTIVAVVNV
ncbi:MAG: DUF1236 domain-containing protein [Xanthobacteraceae bacterium]